MSSPAAQTRTSPQTDSPQGPLGNVGEGGDRVQGKLLLASTVTTVLGTRVVERGSIALTERRLRVLAYHAVTDPRTFALHIEHLASRYHPVSGRQVADALLRGEALPSRPVWITFDDASASLVEHALPVLADAGVPATAFACPGLADRGEAFWWQVVETAVRRGPIEVDGREWFDSTLVTHLKSVPDAERRALVDTLASDVDPGLLRPMSRDELLSWHRSGFEVGNHTWDHPCLDQLGVDEQRRQIERSHDALTTLLGTAPVTFAYPNGDWTPSAEATLSDLGYSTALLFDHRLCTPSTNPLRVSRLRIDADAPLNRLRAVTSGAHSGMFRATARFDRRRTPKHTS